MKPPTPHARPPRPHKQRPASSRSATPLTETKLLLVAFRSGEAVRQHPDVQPWLSAGWTVRRAVPRVVESGKTKLLVVLERPVFALAPRPEGPPTSP